MLTEKKKSGAAPVAHTPPSSRVLYDFLGHVGKGNLPVKRTFSCLIVIPLFVASCALPARVSRNIGTGETLPLYGIEGRWAGPVTPDDPSCGRTTTGLMSVGSDTFGFDPFQSTAVIQGTVQKRKLAGTLTRSGGNKQTLSLRFEGEATTDSEGKPAITGALVSGRCRWHVVLIRG